MPVEHATHVIYLILVNGTSILLLIAGLSIGFEVDGDILKVDGYEGQRPLTQARGLGAADAPSGVQGAEPRWGSRGRSPREQNEFNV